MSHLRYTGDYIQGKAAARFVESLWHVNHYLILMRQCMHRRCTPLLRYFVQFEQNADFYMLNADQDTLKAARVEKKAQPIPFLYILSVYETRSLKNETRFSAHFTTYSKGIRSAILFILQKL